VPEHLVIVGGSYIGLEFAQMYRRFGARVTVVEMGPRLIGREDPDISDAIRAILQGEGIEVRTDACCIRLAKHDLGVAVGVDCAEGAPEVVGSHVLLAVGRRPNTDDLGLDKAGIATDAKGYIQVDDRLATNVEGVWALGDCNGRGAFTHTAWNDYEIVAANLLDGADRRLSQRIPGYALLRSLTQQIAGSSDDKVWKPALFELEECLVPAFIIEEFEDGRYTIFVPSIPTPFAGAVYIADRARVHPLDVPFTAALRTVSRWGAGSRDLLAGMEGEGKPRADAAAG